MEYDSEKCGENCIYGKLEFMDPNNLPAGCECCNWTYWGSQGPLSNMQHRFIGHKKDAKMMPCQSYIEISDKEWKRRYGDK